MNSEMCKMARSKIKDMISGGSSREYDFSCDTIPYNLESCDRIMPHVTVTAGDPTLKVKLVMTAHSSLLPLLQGILRRPNLKKREETAAPSAD
jgi:hypothetical protein